MPVIFCLLPSSSIVIFVFYWFFYRHQWQWTARVRTVSVNWIQFTGLTLPLRITPVNNPITLISPVQSLVGLIFFVAANSICVPNSFYRAMHFSANARPWDRMSSVRPSVCPSVMLVDCDHIGLKSWKLITRTTSPTHSPFVAKRRSTYTQGNMGKFWGD